MKTREEIEQEIAEAQAAAQALAEKYHGEVTVNGFDADGNVLGSFTGVCRCENCSDERIDYAEQRRAQG